MNTLSRTLFLACSCAIACGDDAADTESPPVVTTVVTTVVTSPTAPTTTSGDETSTTDTTGGLDTASTTDEPLETTTTGKPGDTDDEPLHCLPKPEDPPCEPQARDWCEEAAFLANLHLPEIYAEIIAQNCRDGSEPCTVCFAIANTCSQVGTDCEGLYELCGCLAQAHGEI